MDSEALLATQGYLSLSGFVQYLKKHHPHARIAYPTAVKLVSEGKIRSVRVGKMHRIYRDELERFVREGNYEASGSDLPRSLIDAVSKITKHNLLRKVKT